MQGLVEAAGFVPKIRMEIESNETIKQATMAGLGIAFISAHTVAVEIQRGRLWRSILWGCRLSGNGLLSDASKSICSRRRKPCSIIFRARPLVFYRPRFRCEACFDEVDVRCCMDAAMSGVRAGGCGRRLVGGAYRLGFFPSSNKLSAHHSGKMKSKIRNWASYEGAQRSLPDE